ncbi:hypothetical protein QLQ15_17420 [Lysobacter sp. LF1]|uniref:CENP-V/GFA domain-containing protein n=1 Tax=Lysobacter stagni TaxID=3045172 RepID=A0ABT6XKJ0_9GAMM|nr:hypothetical protein [Lysobacter sp. LF1]MDI9240687.1 hypothetical protein [Lysobacter sp. LF1]
MPLIASCHCGATKIQAAEIPRAAKECNCSFCARTGAVWAYYKPGELLFVSQDDEQTYSATGMNRHHFCGRCGMHTWGDSPDWASSYNADGTPKEGVTANTVPQQRIYAVNLRLVDDLDWSAIAVEKMDGRNNW